MADHTTTNQATLVDDDEIDLGALFAAIWQGKWIITGCAFLFAALATAFALWLPNIYRAEALLAPSVAESKAGLAGLAGQFGGLASLAGIDLGGGATDKVIIALEVLKSRAFLTDFIRRHKLEVPLMAAKGWSRETGEWILDTTLFDPVTSTWIRDVKPPKSVEPSDWELYEIFKNVFFTVSQDKQTGMITLGIEAYSPIAAQQWAAWLVEDVNQRIRLSDITEAEKSIDYLREQLEKTSLADMQQIFYQLIEKQTQSSMLASIKKEYVFKTVDAAVIPEEKIKPKRSLIVLGGLLLGGFIGLVVVLARSHKQSEPVINGLSSESKD